MKEMVGGCCVCSDDRGWAENPLVYCDGQGCTVAVHQACYGIVTVPQGNWYCRKCESQERSVKVRCELCPSRDGALKPTDNNGWAHVVCALYIPEVRFGNVTTMEPIILHQIPQERFTKNCYICEESNKGSRATVGACMQCNKVGCRQQFHVTCAQSLGLLCEEAGNYLDNVKYCGYCHHHYTKLKKGGNVKPIPPYRPVSTDSPEASPGKEHNDTSKTTSKRKLRGGKTPPSTTVAPVSTSPPEPSSPRPLTPGAKLSLVTTASSSTSASSSSATAAVTPSVSAVVSGPHLVPLQPQPPPPPAPLTAHPNPSPPGGVLKPGSIVVQVPLEAAMPSGGGAPPPPLPATSPPSIEQPDLPAKRARSQSSEKSEKGRRSKRTSGGGGGSGNSSSKGGGHSSGSNSAASSGVVVSGGPPPSAVVHPTTHHHQQPQSSTVNSSSGAVAMKSIVNSNSGGVDDQHSSHKSRKTVVKEEKDIKIFQNGVSAPHMLGNQLNPSSTMAQKMCDTLSQEVAAHSIFSTEPNLSTSTNLIGPHLPKSSSTMRSGSGPSPSSGSNGGVSWNNSIPQSLDQLLERQWEQGSQFLMEQAQHFDIASLLSCLHQLRAENAQLEEHVNSLLARRDHLLAVNARLAIPLVQVQPGAATGASSAQQQGSSGGGPVRPGSATQQHPAIVENGVASPAEQQAYHSRSTAPPQAPVRSQQSHSGQASNGCFVVGGGSGSNPLPVVPQSTVVVRASSVSSSSGTVVTPSSVPPPSLPTEPHRRVASTSGYPNTLAYSTNQPSTSQQSQVVMRRTGESQQQLSSSTGDQQSQPPGHIQSQPPPPNPC